MVVLIFLKWGMAWQVTYNTCFAPSIIGVFINMALHPTQFTPVTDPTKCEAGENYPLFGSEDGADQVNIQGILLKIALICVPIILIPKPLFEWIKHKRSSDKSSHTDANMEQKLLHDHEVRNSSLSIHIRRK